MKKSLLIYFKNITKTYITGPVKYQALKGIDFKIRQGEFVSIMGPSGSGKSTIMNIIGALDTPTTGLYKLKGKDISHYMQDELAEIRNKEIGFVFQSFNLLPRTTVMKNVIRPMMYSGVKKKERYKRAMDKLGLVGLTDKANNLSNHLSGGQIQRVAIARALVMNPSIVLADEPTGNLDTKTAEEIMETLAKLNKQGTTVIVITHEENIAEFAKRTIRVKDGLVEVDRKTRRKNGI
ncbi:MAG: ABC transporter ATP-binding protein [Patescibacteria group bacterium]|nr:ABC transporter ATP-binding protein [Patescibacteria group bacterium]